MKPLILAAGKGSRYEGKTAKPLMVVTERPVLFDALHTLNGIGFSSSEITIVVNEENRTDISKAIGDNAIKLVVQEELTGPATAVKSAYDADPRLDEALVVQADDAHWFGSIMGDFARFHDRRQPVASMALVATGDPGVHFSTYDVGADGMIIGQRHGLPEHKNPRQGCNAGIYVIGRASFMAAYGAVGPPRNNDLGLPSVINHMLDSELPVAGPVYEIPWKSANTVAGLEVARAISHSTRVGLGKVTLAEVMAYGAHAS